MSGRNEGHRGLQLEELLVFERGAPDKTGVDLEPPAPFKDRLGTQKRRAPIGLPGLSEPEAMRHYTRLSQKNYGIDMGIYPLGSCTMKHNPRLNERVARLAGFADIHPMQPVETVQGALAVIDELVRWITTLTGMPTVAISLGAGAHGELCGLMAIRAALEAQGDARKVVLVPNSAHGTNPATAHMCGYTVESIPHNARGRVDLAALKARLGPDVAAFMLTNPNTCGLFEHEILAQADAVHAAGAFFYCDGANFNALMGRVRPGDLGIDCMHLNLHKTFSTPHGGGGPGSGPVAFAESLARFAPLPWVVKDGDAYRLAETDADAKTEGATPFGRMKGFHGQFGMFVRALTYMMSHGGDGLKQASGDAVLAANYVLESLKDVMSPFADGPCMHECLFHDAFLHGTGVTTLDFAKAMIDEGYHPMTMYFPLVVHGGFLIEPTESESRDGLDNFIAAMRRLAERAKAGDAEFFTGAPHLAPRRRLDETRAARHPVLRWRPPGETSQAAE